MGIDIGIEAMFDYMHALCRYFGPEEGDVFTRFQLESALDAMSKEPNGEAISRIVCHDALRMKNCPRVLPFATFSSFHLSSPLRLSVVL